MFSSFMDFRLRHPFSSQILAIIRLKNKTKKVMNKRVPKNDNFFLYLWNDFQILLSYEKRGHDCVSILLAFLMFLTNNPQ